MKIRKLASVAAVGGAAFLYAIGCSPSTPDDETSLTRFREGELAQLMVPGELDAPNPRFPEMEPTVFQPDVNPPAMTFEGPDGAQVSLADFPGQVVVVNLWATWCAPCKVEMPTLAALQTTYEGQPVKVIALSADMEPEKAEAREVIAALAPLEFYHTPGTNILYEFEPDVAGLPTTIIYGKDGKERARLVAPADWNGAPARALIDAILAEG